MKFQLLIAIIYVSFSFPFCLCILQPELSDVNVPTDNVKENVERTGNKAPPRCLAPQNLPNPTNVNDSFFFVRRYFYYTGGSSYGYGLLAKMLLGRNVQSQYELNQMCPGIAIGADPVIYNGYGVEFFMHCTFPLPHQGNCIVSTNSSEYDGKLGVNPYIGFTSVGLNLVATDSKTYAIYYLCYDGTYGDYQLLTTRPFVSPSVVKIFIDMKNQLGFYQSQPLLPVCVPPQPNQTYPYPFQNYPALGNPNLGWSQSQSQSGWSSPTPNGWHS